MIPSDNVVNAGILLYVIAGVILAIWLSIPIN